MERVIRTAARKGVDFADLRITDSTNTSIMVQDGRADKISAGEALGAGLRVLVDGAWGFAPTNNIAERQLLQALDDAIAMARTAAPSVTDPGMVAQIEPVEASVRTEYKIDPRQVPLKERVAAIFALEEAARQQAGDKLANVVASYGDAVTTMYLANTYGTYLQVEVVRCGVNVFVTATDNGELQWASKRRAKLGGYELISSLDPEQFAGEPARKAVALLSARPAPAGTFEVIIDPIICGLLVHEAFGHNCEADAVWAGESILEGKIGQQVAHESVTIIDDPTLPGLNGSFVYDHEGVQARQHRLVHEGTLESYLHSLETAARFGVRPQGSARAQGYSFPPIVRMSNTFVAPGDCSFQEMLSDTKKGLYLTGGNWGYVFTARGQFTCNVEEAYAIENGKLGQHYRNVSISGLTLETLRSVTAVGNDLRFELGGTCGKDGQSMPVDAGGPHLRIRNVVVGGRG